MLAGRIAVASLAIALLLSARAGAANLQVVSTAPAQNRFAPAGTTIAITFDQPLLTSSVTSSSVRVFGRQTGPASGPIVFSNGGQTLAITPSRPSPRVRSWW